MAVGGCPGGACECERSQFLTPKCPLHFLLAVNFFRGPMPDMAIDEAAGAKPMVAANAAFGGAVGGVQQQVSKALLAPKSRVNFVETWLWTESHTA